MNIMIKSCLLMIFSVVLVSSAADSSHFFIVSGDSNSSAIDFDLKSGMLEWTSSSSVSTIQVFYAKTLTQSNNWVEYTQIVSEEKNNRSKVVDIFPPAGMAYIPIGMNEGSNPVAPDDPYSTPINQSYPSEYHNIVDGFYMDTSEVSKKEWDNVYSWAITNGYDFVNRGSAKALSHPVHSVNWYDCIKWCNARSEMQGRTPCYKLFYKVYRSGENINGLACDFTADGYRLPTGNEWEFAARGGSKNQRFPWGNTINHNNANYAANGPDCSYDTSSYNSLHPIYETGSLPYTSPCKSFEANQYGLYDMIGNVSEWCWGLSGSTRISRGGSWVSSPRTSRIAYTVATPIHHPYYGKGFRCVHN